MNKKAYMIFVAVFAVIATCGCTGASTQQSSETGQTSVTVEGDMEKEDMSDGDVQVVTPGVTVDTSGDGVSVETPGVSVDINQ